jgi:hypothetical protein
MQSFICDISVVDLVDAESTTKQIIIITIIIIIIIRFYVGMYVYCPFSPHNGITIGNVLILFFSPVNANFNFS